MASVHPVNDTIYDPFRRSDRYGDMGQARQPVMEQLRLLLMACLVLPFRVLGILTCVSTCYLACQLSRVLPAWQQAAFVPWIGKRCARACLWCIGFVSVRWVSCDQDSEQPQPSAVPAGIVSNHMGWSDILVHMSHSFPSFVARASTRDLPMVGLISQNMGCIYVEREHKTATTQGVSTLVKERMLHAGSPEAAGMRPMLLFPEGTTSNGKYLLPFKTGAFLAGRPVQPVVLKYGQGRVSMAWDSIDAKRHIFLALCAPYHTVTVYELPVYVPTAEEQKDPVLYAANVRDYMLRRSGLKPAKAVLQDKRAYHALLQGKTPASVKKSE
uniref:LPEAT n=1 Tax=Lobosphaera incisa TaxID=312850 RepID=A0A386RTJ1_9CHLO|nr:LPEAT [Lobosphaera incisa]